MEEELRKRWEVEELFKKYLIGQEKNEETIKPKLKQFPNVFFLVFVKIFMVQYEISNHSCSDVYI